MIALIKLLKIVLPVATVTTATVLTTSLISSGKSDLDKKKEDEDKEINDFVKPSEDFEEEKLFYSKDGDADKLKTVDKETANQIEKLMKESGGKLTQGKKLGDTVQEQKSEINSGNHENQTQGDTTKTNPSKNTLSEDGDSAVSSVGDQEENSKLSELSSPADQSEISSKVGERDSAGYGEPILDVKKEDEEGQKGNKETKDRNEESLDLQSQKSAEEQSHSSVDNSITEGNDGFDTRPTNVISEETGGKNSEINLDRSGTKGAPEDLEKGDNEIFSGGNSDKYSDESIRRLEEMQGELSAFENSLRQLIS